MEELPTYFDNTYVCHLLSYLELPEQNAQNILG